VSDELSAVRAQRMDEPASTFGLEGDNYDWREALHAEEEQGRKCSKHTKFLALGPEKKPSDPFTWADVSSVIASSEGQHDERDWLAVGELDDGRFFFLQAGCDYTGWG